jgi:hypothetical protein
MRLIPYLIFIVLMIKGAITTDYIGLKIADGLKEAKQDIFVSDFVWHKQSLYGQMTQELGNKIIFFMFGLDIRYLVLVHAVYAPKIIRACAFALEH